MIKILLIIHMKQGRCCGQRDPYNLYFLAIFDPQNPLNITLSKIVVCHLMLPKWNARGKDNLTPEQMEVVIGLLEKKKDISGKYSEII